jgi:hypothetical protein
VSDDGWSDRTKSILRAFQKSLEPGKVEVVDGPRRGAPPYFLFLACAGNLVDDFYADLLQHAASAIPAFYGSRTRLIGENGHEIGFPPKFRRRPDFRCALVQGIGNTMVFRQKPRELLSFGGADVNVPSHGGLYQRTSVPGHCITIPTLRCAIVSTPQTSSARTSDGLPAFAVFGCLGKGVCGVGKI